MKFSIGLLSIFLTAFVVVSLGINLITSFTGSVPSMSMYRCNTLVALLYGLGFMLKDVERLKNDNN